ncbi:hypothetical protein PM082_008692 [Marasmius tenuissimus]|nr:hypothetical protein PM082_008692 [Marasmius tenuissimus]
MKGGGKRRQVKRTRCGSMAQGQFIGPKYGQYGVSSDQLRERATLFRPASDWSKLAKSFTKQSQNYEAYSCRAPSKFQVIKASTIMGWKRPMGQAEL